MTKRLSPVMTLTWTCQLREVAEYACGVGLGRVEEEQETGEDHLRFVVALVGPLG